jgi:ketosteroid isomerase-like protein
MTKMWRMLTIVALMAGAACTTAAPPAQNADADKAKLQADALSWFDFYSKADGEGMANLYAADALLMPPGAAAVTGRAAIKTFLGEDAAKTKSAGLTLKNGTVTGAEVSGDTGWVSGNYTVVDGSGAAIDSGSYLSVHRRTNDVWLYTRDIWNSDRAPAPAAAPPK